MHPREMGELIDRYHEAHAADDVARTLSLMREDIRLEVVGAPFGPLCGREAVGAHLERFRVRRVRTATDADGPWSRLARFVMRRPVAILVPTLAGLLILGSPFLHVRFNAPDSTILPERVPSRVAYDRLVGAFGEGPFAPISLAIQTSGPVTEAGQCFRGFSFRLATAPHPVSIKSGLTIQPSAPTLKPVPCNAALRPPSEKSIVGIALMLP